MAQEYKTSLGLNAQAITDRKRRVPMTTRASEFVCDFASEHSAVMTTRASEFVCDFASEHSAVMTTRASEFVNLHGHESF